MTVAGRMLSMLGVSAFFKHRLSAFRKVTRGFYPGRLMICLGSSSIKSYLAGSRKALWEPQGGHCVCGTIRRDPRVQWVALLVGAARGCLLGRVRGWKDPRGQAYLAPWELTVHSCPGNPLTGLWDHSSYHASELVTLKRFPPPQPFFKSNRDGIKQALADAIVSCVRSDRLSPGMRSEVCSSVEWGPCLSLTLKESQRQDVGLPWAPPVLWFCVSSESRVSRGGHGSCGIWGGRQLPWRWHPGLVLLWQTIAWGPSPTLPPPSTCPTDLTCMSCDLSRPFPILSPLHVIETWLRPWKGSDGDRVPMLWFDWLRLYSRFFKTCLWKGVACTCVSLELTVGAGDAGAGPQVPLWTCVGLTYGQPLLRSTTQQSSSWFQPGGDREGRDPLGGVCSWLGQRFHSGC